MTKLMNSVPGRKVKRELSKGIVQALLGGKISVDDLAAINEEIDNAHYTNGDPQTIILAAQAGLVGEKTGSVALGFDDDEYLAARTDHAERLKLIAESQGMRSAARAAAIRRRGASRTCPPIPTLGRKRRRLAATPISKTPRPRASGAGKPKLT